jgi:hypothetical protein
MKNIGRLVKTMVDYLLLHLLGPGFDVDRSWQLVILFMKQKLRKR